MLFDEAPPNNPYLSTVKEPAAAPPVA